MIPVYQTIFSPVNGNCWAAVWASLLHLSLEQVPNFVEADNPDEACWNFIRPYGYQWGRYLVNPNRRDLSPEERAQYEYFGDALPDYGHIDGYYEAVVWSPGWHTPEKPVCHAVVVDRHLNIVHDPHPGYSARSYPYKATLGYNGLIGVCLYDKAEEVAA